MDPLVCFSTPVVVLVYVDWVGVPDFEPLVPVEAALVAVEVAVEVVAVVEGRRKRIKYGCIRCSRVDVSDFQIATQRCLLV